MVITYSIKKCPYELIRITAQYTYDTNLFTDQRKMKKKKVYHT